MKMIWQIHFKDDPMPSWHIIDSRKYPMIEMERVIANFAKSEENIELHLLFREEENDNGTEEKA
jgi:hypothetical protein